MPPDKRICAEAPKSASRPLFFDGNESTTVKRQPKQSVRIVTPQTPVCKCIVRDGAYVCGICTKKFALSIRFAMHPCHFRPKQNVNKAGTPGFRAPEVLLRSPDQTTAIDVWAAGTMRRPQIAQTFTPPCLGVIFLSLCCKRHPIMRVNDDFEALGQIAFLFGGAKLQDLAASLGKRLHMTPCPPGVDLVDFCRTVAGS
jgi:serine/threonine protein kinase